MRKYFILLFVLLIPKAFSQNVEATASLDTNAIFIGQQNILTLKAEADQEVNIVWPQYNDTVFDILRVIEISEIDTLFNENSYIYEQKVRLTCFDSGYYAIPRLSLSVNGQAEVKTQAILLEVKGVAVDTTGTIKPIIGPVKQFYTLNEILLFVLIIALVALIVLLIIHLYKKYKKKHSGEEIVVEKKEIIPPNVKATNSLNKLDSNNIIEKQQLKNYYTSVTDILRLYIYEVYKVPAQELTSFEIFDMLKGNKGITKDLLNNGNDIFNLSDQVKFAKYMPNKEEHIEIVHEALNFVNDSWSYLKSLNSQQENDK